MTGAKQARLRHAKEQREWMVEQLERCVCAWPIDVMRNGSGHASDCPAHAAYEESRK